MDLEAYPTVSEQGRAIENHVFYDFFFFCIFPLLRDEIRLHVQSYIPQWN